MREVEQLALVRGLRSVRVCTLAARPTTWGSSPAAHNSRLIHQQAVWPPSPSGYAVLEHAWQRGAPHTGANALAPHASQAAPPPAAAVPGRHAAHVAPPAAGAVPGGQASGLEGAATPMNAPASTLKTSLQLPAGAARASDVSPHEATPSSANSIASSVPGADPGASSAP
ncbi:MAG: hypothetical protein J3K34DRAFT_412699 [Monoraphidium minutum]|nr:MAG: hypothetical protein J3K34DRAFT_412699 [Monoraphidium minutum]